MTFDTIPMTTIVETSGLLRLCVKIIMNGLIPPTKYSLRILLLQISLVIITGFILFSYSRGLEN